MGLLFMAGAMRGATTGFFLEVEMANPGGGSAALFYDIGQWYSQQHSSRLNVPAGTALQVYRFAIPPAPVRRLRFDLTDHAGLVTIGRLRLTNATGDVLDEFGPECVQPMHAIESCTIANGVAVVQAGADNPMVLIDRLLQPKTTAALGLALIGSPTLSLLALGIIGAMLFAVVVALRAMPERKLAAWFFAGAFLIILGARLAWLNAYSRPMPYWDEWEIEGVNLLMPLRGGFLDWGALFVPQSEHRTVVSRLLVVFGCIVNGEWDPRVTMVAGAVMSAASMALVCALTAAWRLRFALIATVAVIALAVFPFDARNLLCGDQCQMYALNLMTVVILCLSVARPSRAVIAAAVLASTVSIFTMASGGVAPLIAAGFVFVRTWATPGERRAMVGLGAVFMGIGLAGFTLYSAATFHAPAYAHTWHDFSVALVERMSWPLSPSVGHVLVVWLPWLIFAASLLRPRRRFSPIDGFLFGLGGWLLANAIGLAHGRPFNHWPFDNRYYTSMLLIALVTVLCVLQLATQRRTLLLALLGLGLASPVLIATRLLFAQSAAAARDYWRQECAFDDVVRPFLRTGDRTLLYDLNPGRLPYWNGAELAAQLDSPLMQPWLPAPLRQCVAQRPDSPLHGEQSPGPLTIACRSAMKAGIFLAGGGVWLLAFSAMTARTKRDGPGRFSV